MSVEITPSGVVAWITDLRSTFDDGYVTWTAEDEAAYQALITRTGDSDQHPVVDGDRLDTAMYATIHRILTSFYDPAQWPEAVIRAEAWGYVREIRDKLG